MGNQGICETEDAELERWIGYLKPEGMLGDSFRGFRFPASPPSFIGLNQGLLTVCYPSRVQSLF